MDRLLFIMWILPEIGNVLFILLWPLFWRAASLEELERAAKTLGLQVREAVAMCNYHLDLNLATMSFITLGFSFLKLLVLIRVSTGAVPTVALISSFLYGPLVAMWLVLLHKRNDPARYATVPGDGVSVFGKRGGRHFLVPGPWGRRIWWTRVLTAFVGLGLGVYSGVRLLTQAAAAPTAH